MKDFFTLTNYSQTQAESDNTSDDLPESPNLEEEYKAIFGMQ
jgi:hypothetical protein